MYNFRGVFFKIFLKVEFVFIISLRIKHIFEKFF
jgi:hypothetical protein